MAIYVKINDIQYPASITGRMCNKEWGDRASKAITLEMTYDEAINLFVDDVTWSIIQDIEDIVEEEIEVIDKETGEKSTIRKEEYDNSDYCIAGDLVDHRNGLITVYMGKKTDHELEVSALEEENAELLFNNLTGEDFSEFDI